MSKEDNKFPVLHHYRRDPNDGIPDFVEWSALSEKRAQTNHSQTLTRLAERGGLSPREIVANVKDKDYYDVANLGDVATRIVVTKIAIK